jgi:Leucine-rich repeat (LRR) protein
MTTWQPSQLVMLTLPKQNLTYFSVGGLVNLEYLDLSRNAIREIRGMGLEKCNALQHLNLKQNLIQKRENLKVLGFLPCLQYLMLKGNPVTKAPDYRLTGTISFPFPLLLISFSLLNELTKSIIRMRRQSRSRHDSCGAPTGRRAWSSWTRSPSPSTSASRR